MRLDGLGIFVENMAEMIRFYKSVLGFEITEGEDTPNVHMEKDGTLFMLFGRKDFEKMTGKKFSYAPGINGHYEIALSARSFADVDRIFHSVTAAGATAVMEPTTMPWGQRTCYIADPEGNLVEIGSFEESE